MSEPLQHWREGVSPTADASTRRAAALVEQTAAITPRPVELANGWERVLGSATRPQPSGLVLALCGLAAALAGVLATASVMKSRTSPVVVATSGTQWRPERDGAVQLQRGRVQTVRRVSLRLESPQVSLVAKECSFAAEVISEGTRVTVFEGEAVVRGAEGTERVVKAGESVLWPAAPMVAASLTAQVPASPEATCSDAPCLEAIARGDNLRAEVALFELARRQPERSVDWLRASLARFPEGVLVPEVRLALLAELVKQRRFAEALETARAFEASASEDPRVDDVRALRRQLEWFLRPR